MKHQLEHHAKQVGILHLALLAGNFMTFMQRK